MNNRYVADNMDRFLDMGLNGEEVVCNASTAPFTYHGVTLPAKTHRPFTR